MGKVEKSEKLNKPGLWFMRSIQPAKELGRYVYELTVELGRPIVVYSNSSKKEIQNTVIDLIKTKCIENAPDITERVWLEQAMSEYNTHGLICHPEERNEFIPDDSFWSEYVFFDEYKILSFTNSFSHLYLIDNLSELWLDDEGNLSQSLLSIEKEAVEYKKTIIVFFT
ncbi:MAG: hypothetical protein IJJ98_12435 [Prevotella sp.]|nr:hypothetical protein [Prevotella sp.]